MAILAGRRTHLPSLLLFCLLVSILPFPSPAHGRGRLDNSQRLPSPKRRVYIRKSPLTRGPEQYSRCDAAVKRLSSAVFMKEDEVIALEKETIYLGRLAANTVRKGLHCLSLQLTIQYYNNRLQHQAHPTDTAIFEDNQFYHYVIYSENILAAAAVINSTASNAKEPHKHVFHVLTNGLNYAAMQMWFWAYPPNRSSVEVKNLDNVVHISGILRARTIREQFEIDPLQTSFKRMEKDGLIKLEKQGMLQGYLPEIFPKLDKVFVLHDDVVIMKDLSSLRDKGFSSIILGISNSCSANEGGVWCSCVNVVNLQEWRDKKLKLRALPEHNDTTNIKDMPLENVINVFNVDEVNVVNIKDAAVIHYSGHGKPWLELGMSRYKSFWTHFVNYGNPILQECNIHS